jgi:arylsulfatase A-like enzyme
MVKFKTFSYLNTKIVWLFATAAVFGGGCGKEVPPRPNFLVIVTDDLAYRAIGYNNEKVKTPNLDRLARDGMIFSRAYITTPVCAASRASLLTGLYPQTNGTVALDKPSFIKNVVTGKKYATLPQFLNTAGYTTWFSGKSHLDAPGDYGFRYGVESQGFDDQRTFKDASAFVDRIAAEDTTRQFFMWVAARQPHVPLHPGQEWLDLYNPDDISLDRNFREEPLPESFFNQGVPGMNYYRDSDYTDNHMNLPAGPPRSPEIMKEFIRAYYATISHLDFQIGQLIEKMESKGLMENTMIIFLSDNGYFLGNHGLGNKLTMHEESVRIPFFIYWDKLKEKSKSTDALISSIDMFPTVLELAGIDIPDYIQGVSLHPLLSGSLKQIREYVVSESVGVGGTLGEGHRMVVTDEWKYILSDTGDEALFNLKEDLYELDNQIEKSEKQSIVSQLKTYLQEWKVLTGDQKNIPGL